VLLGPATHEILPAKAGGGGGEKGKGQGRRREGFCGEREQTGKVVLQSLLQELIFMKNKNLKVGEEWRHKYFKKAYP